MDLFMKKAIRWISTGLCALLAISLAGCAGGIQPKSPTDKTPSLNTSRHTFEAVTEEQPQREGATGERITGVKVGFVYIGLPGDYGFTYEQNQGRLALMDELGVETLTRENVPRMKAALRPSKA